jgi:glyoxylase-like metal-dependent hydrolase (beta-lactamase superfamily II)
MAVDVAVFVCGPFATNTFLVRSGGACWVIDPGIGPTELVATLRREQLVPDRIVLTHGHCDHVAGIADVREAAGGVPVWCPAADAEMPADARRNLSEVFGLPMVAPPPNELFAPGDTLELGETAWEVLDTSGHTAGGVSLYAAAEGIVFTGDALFAGSIGRTDLPGGDGALLVANIRRALLSLPDDTQVYPGHGPASTIGQERRTNPFLGGDWLI